MARTPRRAAALGPPSRRRSAAPGVSRIHHALPQLTVKEEQMDTNSDPHTQKGRLRPIPREVPEYARGRVTLAHGQRIIRGICGHGYLDEMSYYYLFGNEVTLHKRYVDTLNSLIDAKKIFVPCYICTMNKTFAARGQRMEYLKGHMHEGHTDLPIKAGNGPAVVIARLIM